MAKLTILATALIALLALAHATQTTITTTVVEEENPGQQQRCREQIQRQQNLHDCQSYLQQQAREYEVAMITNQNPQQQQLRQCCQQLENLDDQCRCEGIRETVRQQREQGEMQGEEMREMMQQAENLPSRCNLSPRRCQIRASLF
ncbi:2S sulfur-rich seed storage protein 2-like [Rhododendron vialii]|uniref:2S sulfur-rich seed storage protein 2-like n=1 Tax=Rhododendron vialii TaxID=182163 RepID=UPI00265F7BD3|nr:2S sulfur-rich seed storage protein 2-like [Rhododendron vialii]